MQISEKENIGLEMQFKEQGKMLVRVVDPTYIETKTLKEYPGTYQIKGNKISYNIVFSEKFKQEPKTENQYIEIDGSSMLLKPVEFDGKVINQYKKIDTWTLRL